MLIRLPLGRGSPRFFGEFTFSGSIPEAVDLLLGNHFRRAPQRGVLMETCLAPISLLIDGFRLSAGSNGGHPTFDIVHARDHGYASIHESS